MKKQILFLLLVNPMFSLCQVDLQNGLIAFYPFTGNANNVVSNSLHGVLKGDITPAIDRFGNYGSAYHFNGINTNIVVKDLGTLSNPAFSVCYYFKAEQYGLQVIAGKINFEDGNAATFNSGVFYGGDNIFFGTMNSLNDCQKKVPSTFVYTIKSNLAVSLNQWYCVVNTFEKGVERIYINGMLVSEESLPFSDATYCTNTDFIIGSWWKDDPWWFKGVVDDVRLYDRAITEEEVKVLCSIEDTKFSIAGDSIICKGGSVQLNAFGALSHTWSPSETLNNSGISNPVATPFVSTTYYLNSLITGSNLVVNGDFINGNIGFTSDYNYTLNNTIEGEYYIGKNPNDWNNSFPSSCKDYSGFDNMLIVNGDANSDVVVWSQTIVVSPNTDYAFSTWIQSFISINPAQLMFSINGTLIGDIFSAGLPNCNWSQYFTIWNSGSNTTAVISILNKNTTLSGNDFALDNISFAQVFSRKDSIRIEVEDPILYASPDSTICENQSVQLNATASFFSYQWTPSTGLSATNIFNPVASPTTTTTYIVKGVTSLGCIARDTVDISVIPKPSLILTKDTLLCEGNAIQLNAEAVNVAYLWSPSLGLTDYTISNPIAKPMVNTTYVVEVTDMIYGCKRYDSVRVNIHKLPVFSVSGNQEICAGDYTTLQGFGGDAYIWTSLDSIEYGNLSSITISPPLSTTYSVKISDGVCKYDTVISLSIVVNSKPVIIAQKSNDINCTITTARLNASGGTQYIWSPTESLDKANIPNPLASPGITTTYTVKGFNQYGCSASDSVDVKVIKEGNALYLLPNAFTPNGDGINDCYGLKQFKNSTELDFKIYNRWGELVFYTKNPDDCWDGTYKGKDQPTGTFIYVIRAKALCGDINKKGFITLIR